MIMGTFALKGQHKPRRLVCDAPSGRKLLELRDPRALPWASDVPGFQRGTEIVRIIMEHDGTIRSQASQSSLG